MAGEQARIELARKWITSGFEALEVIVKETAREYCFGDEFTLVDVTLVPQLRSAHRFNVDMAKFLTLQQIERNLYQLELVKNSTPDTRQIFKKMIIQFRGSAKLSMHCGHVYLSI